MIEIKSIIKFIFTTAYKLSKFSTKKLIWYTLYLISSAFFAVNTWSLLYFAFSVGSFLYMAWTIISSVISVFNLIISALLFLDKYRLKLKEESRSHENIYYTNYNANNSVYELIKIDDENESEIMTV